MSQALSTKATIFVIAGVAAFLAIMAAGPGMLLIPAAVRLTEPIVCGENERIEYRTVRSSYRAPGESSVEVSMRVNCVGHADGASREVSGRAVLTLFGIYFVVLFAALMFWLRTATVSSTPREPSPT